MKKQNILLALFFAFLGSIVSAQPKIDLVNFGKSFGGWKEKKGRASQFEVAGSRYRCWKPEVTPTPIGGIFVSIRIDHLRGVLATDDHASLEVTFDAEGNVVSARSSIALQGKKVASDLVEGTGKVGATIAGLDMAAKVGAEMISSLSAKILRENIKEPGRVSFPAVMRHQYHLLCLSVGVEDRVVLKAGEVEGAQKKRTVVPLRIERPSK